MTKLLPALTPHVIRLLFVFAFTATASAATINVDTGADVVAADGLTSLREAFDAANSNGEDDRIVLQTTITYEFNDCAAGPFEVTECKAVVLVGNNAILRKTCAGDTPLMNVEGTTTLEASDLVVEELTMRGNPADVDFIVVAAIEAFGRGTLTIRNSVFEQFRGGPVVFANSFGEVVLDSTDFLDNEGGACSADVMLNGATVYGGTFSGNGGDAINLTDVSPLDVRDVIVSNNGGRGIRTTEQGNARMTVSNSTVTNNREGGIECSACVEMRVNNVTVTDNGALNIGDFSSPAVSMAAQIEEANSPVIFAVTDSSIENNLSNQPGAGISFTELTDSPLDALVPGTPAPTVSITNTSVVGNVSDSPETDAGQSGGGVYIEMGAVTISSNSRINNNTAGIAGVGVSGAVGGGIYVNEIDPVNLTSSLTIENAQVNGNTANGAGGGIYYHGAGTVRIIDSEVSDNSAMFFEGGGVAAKSADVEILRSTIADNKAFRSGGIAFGDAAGTIRHRLRITESTVSNNVAEANGGGGVTAHAATTNTIVSVLNSTISGNETADAGGGLQLSGPIALQLRHATIAENSANEGGNLALTDAALVVSNSVIAKPQLDQNCRFVAGVSFTTNGYNFADDDSCDLGALDMEAAVDPLLGPLADNGGSTATYLPEPTSPVAGLVPVAACTTPSDQRQTARPQGAGCGAGAVEIEEAPVGPAPIMGTDGNDILLGTTGPDIIIAGDGNDLLLTAVAMTLCTAAPAKI